MSLEMLGADSGWIDPFAGDNAGAPSASDLPIKRGSSNANAVKWVQSKVGVAADGKFGPDTEKAVKAYQLSHMLKTDGIVGPLTLAAMTAGGNVVADPVAVAKGQEFDQMWTENKSNIAKRAAAAAAGGGGTCGAGSHSWQSSVAMIVFLLLLAFVVFCIIQAWRYHKNRERLRRGIQRLVESCVDEEKGVA